MSRRTPPKRGGLAALFFLVVVACGKRAASIEAGVAGADAGATEQEPDAGVIEPREAAAWEAARGGDPEELMRLVDLVGCQGLRERAEHPELRATALAAMGYCDDFGELPWLARLGMGGNDADARVALEAIVGLAAQPRQSTDPEDAEELHAGCQELLRLARDPARPRDRRILAIRALRMLSERGCVKRAEIPGDLDAK